MPLSSITGILMIVAATIITAGALEGYTQYTLPQESGQYFTQDAYGQYSYGYAGPHARKQERRTIDGVTRGAYSYLDANGVWQTVQYVADANGIRFEATNLPHDDSVGPEPVTETIEVAAARAHHLAAHEQLKSKASVLLESPQSLSGVDKESVLPQPVQDTDEVAAAKLEFFRLYEEELQRHKLIREQRLTNTVSPRLVSIAPILPESLTSKLSYVPL